MREQSTSVLIGEPLKLVRAGLRALVEAEAGLAVAGDTGDGTELLRLVTRLRPDILVLELGLPGPAAVQLLAEAAAIHPELKVVILAAPQELSGATALLEAGAFGCVLKSDRREEFLRALHSVAAGELAVSSSAARGLLRQRDSQHALATDFLTEREREILDLLTSGLSNKEIAQKLYLSVRTVEVHLRNLYGKLGVRSRLEAVTQTMLQSPEGH